VDCQETVQEACECYQQCAPDAPPTPTEPCPLDCLKKLVGDALSLYEKAKDFIDDPSLEAAKALLREASKALADAQCLIPLKELEKAKEAIDFALEKIEQAEQVIESVKKVAEDTEKLIDDPSLENAGALLGSTKDALADAEQALDEVLPAEAKQYVRQAQQYLGDAQKAVNEAASALE